MHTPDAADARRLADEFANSLTHGVGLALAVAGFVVLLVLAALRGSTLHLVACGVYGVTLVALYAASTLYHSARDPRRKRLLRVVDHCAIFLLIAGTYTPFALIHLPPGWGWSILATVWTMAALGIIYKVLFLGRYPRVGLAMYLAMGWLGLVAAGPIVAHVPPHAVALMAAGGLLYTGGVWFFVRDHQPFRHAIWHLFVLGGSACHYVAILTSAIPLG